MQEPSDAEAVYDGTMGFSSTFVTQWHGGSAGGFPEWFVRKWQDSVHFSEGYQLPLSSKAPAEAHGWWAEFEQDLQRAYPWEASGAVSSLVVVYLHECGGITRAEISSEKIRYHDASQWRKTHQNIAHTWGDRCLKDIEEASDELTEYPAI